MRVRELTSAGTRAPLPASAAATPAAAKSSLIRLGGALDSLAKPQAARLATLGERLEDALVAAIMASVDSAAIAPLTATLDLVTPPRIPGPASRGDTQAVDNLRGAILPLLRNRATWDAGWHCHGLSRLAASQSSYDITAVSKSLYEGDAGVAWKNYSDSYFDSSQARATYDALHAAGVMPAADKPLRFVSVSANAATHEVAMYERDAELVPSRPGGRTFLVGDIASVPKRAYPGPTFPRDELFHLQWDASALPLPPSSADVIWDRKGRLWCALTTDKVEGKASPLTALGVLAHYENILRPGGSIVVDAIEGFDSVACAAGLGTDRATALHYLKNGGEVPAGVAPQAEPSTLDALENVASLSGVDLMALIATRFEVRLVGEGNTRCLVLTKPLAS